MSFLFCSKGCLKGNQRLLFNLRASFQGKSHFELRTMRKQGENGGQGVGVIGGCVETRMMMINVAFPGVPSAGLHLSPGSAPLSPSEPCKYNKPVALWCVRSISTKQELWV